MLNGSNDLREFGTDAPRRHLAALSRPVTNSWNEYGPRRRLGYRRGLAIPRPEGRSRQDQRGGAAARAARFARSPQIRAEWPWARLRPPTPVRTSNNYYGT